MRFQSIVLAVLLVSPVPAFAQTPPPPPAPTPRPSLANVQKMLAAAQAKATEMKVGLSCVVVDVRGDLVAAQRMDGVPFLTVEVAKGKATMSAMFGQPSGAMGDRGPALQAVGASAGLNMLAAQGAVPLMMNNQRVGAIGCSGAASQQDEDAAKAGAAAGQ